MQDETLNDLFYTEEVRESWEVIMVLPGVEEITICTFCNCRNVKRVISVERIEDSAFECCKKLAFIRLSNKP